MDDLTVVNRMEPARLNITYAGQQGELPDPVAYDADEAVLRGVAEEALRTGNVPGIDAVADASLADFVIERFPARDDLPYHRISIRPKTAFGAEPIYSWTVYRNPLDYPGKFVVRRFDVSQPPPMPDPEPWAVSNTLEEARATLPGWAVVLARSEHDEPQIVETWI